MKLITAWPIHVCITICVVNYSCIVYDGGVIAWSPVVVMETTTIHMSAWYKYPPIIGYIIPRAKGNGYANARAHRCPSIIPSAISPAYPCRPPFGTGDPYPTIIVVICPSAIVKRCPPPVVVRYPGVAIFSHGPITIAVIGTKVPACTGAPCITIATIVYPVAIWR